MFYDSLSVEGGQTALPYDLLLLQKTAPEYFVGYSVKIDGGRGKVKNQKKVLSRFDAPITM